MERFDGWDTELYHHGIKGQKWGIRRFQNPDGTLTAAGKKRYLNELETGLSVDGQKKIVNQYSKQNIFGTGRLKKRNRIANIVEQQIEKDKDFLQKTASHKNFLDNQRKYYMDPYINPSYWRNTNKASKKYAKMVEKKVQQILGESGKKLMYKDEPDSQVYKIMTENQILADIIRKHDLY